MLRTALLSAAVALLGATSASWLTEGFEVWTAEGARRLAVSNIPVPAPAATLEGPGMHSEDLHEVLAVPGRVTLMSFVYTRCASLCLSLGSSFQQLQGQIVRRRLDGVRLLSISFDPAHDDTAQLQQYALQWGAEPGRWRVATVHDGPALQRLLRDFQVVVIPDGTGGYEHNAALLLIDERGRLVRIFDDADIDAALAHALWIQGLGGGT